MLSLLSLLQVTEHVNCVGYRDVKIEGLSENSEQIEKNDLFFVKKGEKFDGRNYVTQAIQQGASVIIAEDVDIICNVPLIQVKNIHASEKHIVKIFYQHLDKYLYIIGLTGTNGKTSTTYAIESILIECGYTVGVIGTVNYRITNKKSVTILQSQYKNTTPNLLEIMRLLLNMKKSNVKIVIIEVSSHALAQDRVYALNFDQAIFTNLTPEHLDYHKNMNAYFRAKLKLFNMVKKKKNIKNITSSKAIWTNIEDVYGRKIYKQQFSSISPYAYAVQDKSSNLYAHHIQHNIDSMFFTVQYGNKTLKIVSHLIGIHNVSNILSAIGCALIMNIPIPIIQIGIKNLKHIPGRLEYINEKQNFYVCVDFAHTPDAFHQVFKSIKCVPFKRLITIFGCGGDRDKKKRISMGEIAMYYSNYVIVTNDNPRNEDPESIVNNIESGIKKIKNYHYDVILDRIQAIKHAIYLAHKKDFIIILGKGHENYQIINGKIKKFNDFIEAQKQLSLLS